MNKLTKREKRLIYILACIVIFSVGFNYFIKPALMERSNVLDELELLKQTAAEMKIKINGADTISEGITKTRSDLKEITDKFYPLMSNSEIDRLISGILNDNGLEPTGLVISVSASTDGDMGYIQSKYVNVNVTGSIQGLLGVLDYVSDEDALRIASFALNPDENDSIKMTIDFEVFMYAANDGEAEQ